MTYSQTLTNTLYLRNLKSYLILADDNLKLLEKQNEEFIEKVASSKENEDWLEEGSHLNNISWMFLNSLYVTMYASFEHFLFKVAKIIEQHPETKIGLEYIGGHGILNKYINYIHLVGGLSSVDRALAPWDKMPAYQSIRNYLVHNGGMMQENNNKALEEHKYFKFLKDRDVAMAGSLGLIRICNTTMLKAFANDSTLITNNIVREFALKYPKVSAST